MGVRVDTFPRSPVFSSLLPGKGLAMLRDGRERGFSELCKVQGKSPQLCWELCGKGKFLLFPTWHRHFHPQAKKKKKKKRPKCCDFRHWMYHSLAV